MDKPANRRFSVHARHAHAHSARLLEEASFEAAAVAYVEDFHPPMTAGNAIAIIVRDIGTGHEHCFSIDMGSGETAPCGQPSQPATARSKPAKRRG